MQKSIVIIVWLVHFCLRKPFKGRLQDSRDTRTTREFVLVTQIAWDGIRNKVPRAAKTRTQKIADIFKAIFTALELVQQNG